MSEKKGLGETVLGWFVVREEDGDAEVSPDDVIEQYERDGAPPPPDATAPPSIRLQGEVPKTAPGATPDAKVFSQVYQAAQITPEAQERVEKALGLLQALPGETPKEVRKQIVEASLKAFGIPLDQIIETAAEEIQALEAYIQHGERSTQTLLSDASANVAKLQDQIAEYRKLMELQVQSQRAVVKASNDQKLRVQTVLEFFGQEAVARVVRESPKLVEPKKR